MGTGFLVGPNLVLTSAQNIWSFKEKKVGSSIAFWPMFKNSLEGRAYSARKVNVPNELQEG
jgi:V8-like Glu-specific endopeptidase